MTSNSADILVCFWVIRRSNPYLPSDSDGLIIRDMETSSYLYFIAVLFPARSFHFKLNQRPTASSGCSPAAWFPPQGPTSPNQGLATYHLSQAAPLKTTFLGFSSLLFAKTSMFASLAWGLKD